MAAKLVLVAACALLDRSGRVLVAQRPKGKMMEGLWEFPGGKVEAGETPEAAIVRELGEELGVTIAARDLEPLAFASHAYENFHLLMPLYLCREWQGDVHAREGQAVRWAKPEELRAIAMPPADAPLVETLIERLGKGQ